MGARFDGNVLWDPTPVSGYPQGTHRALPEGHDGSEPEYLDPAAVHALSPLVFVLDEERPHDVIHHPEVREDARWHRTPGSPGFEVVDDGVPYQREATTEYVAHGWYEYAEESGR